jgi:hypothetical protein
MVMGLKVGKCSNQECLLRGKPQDVDEANFVCGQCQAPLTEQVKPADRDNRRQKLAVLAGGIFMVLTLAGGAGYYLFRAPADRPAVGENRPVSGATGFGNESPGKKESRESPAPQASGMKSMEKWVEEFAHPEAREPTGPEDYRQVWQTVNRLQSRAGALAALKQAGKVIGNEHGLLNPTTGASLSASEQDLLNQENQDRRSLYAFVSRYSNPPVSYERVAYEYAKNQWKEWPPR